MTPQARPAWWRRALGPVVAALVALALVLGGSAPASAHAELVDTDPDEGAVLETAPTTVTLTFNEPVLLTSQEIAVFDSDGDPVESTARTRDEDVLVDLPGAADLGDGSYVVSWNVLSDDGHPISGALTFSVGAPSTAVTAPPEPDTSSALVEGLRDALTVLSLLGLLVAAGLALFLALVLPRSWSGTETRARLRRLLTYAAAVGAAAAILLVPVASVYGQGLELDSVVSAFDVGLVRNELLSAALVLLGLGLVLQAVSDAPPDRRASWLLGVGALVAVAAPSLVGHSRAFTPTPLVVAADVLHVTAGAVWLGGLLGLVLTMRPLSGRELLAARTLSRFSTLAGGVVLAVAASGSFLAWRILGSWSGLVETPWGWLLLAKIAIALTVAGIGGWNRWRVLPVVRAATGFDDRERAAAVVTRTVRVEAALLVALLGVTGVLVNQSPRPAPTSVEAGATGVGSASLGDLKVLAVLDPRHPGSNTLLVQVQDAAGEPFDPPSNPVVELRTDGLDIGEVTLEPVGAGTYRGEVVLPRAGEWEVQVGLALSRFDNPVTTIGLSVPG